MRIGVVTGLRAEATIAARMAGDGIRVVATGGRPARAVALLDELIAGGCTHLVSFGIAGGLAPGLASGTLVLADRVIDGPQAYPCDGAWLARAAAALDRAGIAAINAPVAACAEIVVTVAAKTALHQAAEAAAVDMESGPVATAARRAGLPFLVLRAIADPATCAVPPAALVGLREDGSTDALAVLGRLCRAPGQLPELIIAALAARQALKALARASICLGRGFGLM
jgi:hopanoid-associated phosphorylase